ncbi:hypothetical protein E4U54_000460 [Claviceps lovelessii]|nr:hypothetical protein E4U54_000460 [Claviceps lovelessii]
MQSTVGININLDTFLFFPNAEAICQHVNSAMGVVAANVAIDGPDLLPDITKTTAAAAAATPGEEGVTPGPQLHNTDPRTVFERTPEAGLCANYAGCSRTQSSSTSTTNANSSAPDERAVDPTPASAIYRDIISRAPPRGRRAQTRPSCCFAGFQAVGWTDGEAPEPSTVRVIAGFATVE